MPTVSSRAQYTHTNLETVSRTYYYDLYTPSDFDDFLTFSRNPCSSLHHFSALIWAMRCRRDFEIFGIQKIEWIQSCPAQIFDPATTFSKSMRCRQFFSICSKVTTQMNLVQHKFSILLPHFEIQRGAESFLGFAHFWWYTNTTYTIISYPSC